jgi:hypothetical protein
MSDDEPKPEAPQTFEEYRKLHPDLDIELDLPQPGYGDDELLKEYGLWMSAFEEQNGRQPSVAEMCEWIEAHNPRT